MNFFSPINWLWLVPIGAGIVLLWMLRPKRVDVIIPSLFLWRAVLADTRAATPFQKLRRSLLLFLQLLAALLLVMALAGPFVYGNGLAGRTLIVVIDNGATMNAADGRVTRLDAAKDAAAEYLQRELRASDRAAVICAGRVPVLLQAPTDNLGRLRDSMDEIAPTDEPPDLFAAAALANALARGKRGAQIRVFTDGAVSDRDARQLATLSFGAADVAQIPVGRAPAPNIGITEMSAGRDADTGRLAVFVALRAFGGWHDAGGTLSLFVNGRLADARPVALTDGAQSETFDSALLQNGGLVTARLDDISDALAADNSASLVVPAPRPVKVLLVSAGNLFLEHGLNAGADVVLSECAPAEFRTWGKNGAGYDVVVLDGFVPPGGLPPGRYLTIHAGSAQLPLAAAGGSMPAPAVVDENSAHPVMRDVDFTGVAIQTAPRTTLAPWAVSLADGDSGPLVAAGSHNGRRIVSVAFALADSDWPLRVSFPIFLGNAETWLAAGSNLGSVEASVAPGMPAELHLPPGEASATVVRPDGGRETLFPAPDGGPFVDARTDRVGVYTAETAGGARYPFAVNLCNADISALPVQNIPALHHAVPAPPANTLPRAARVQNPLWEWAAALALLLLLAEWAVYHRRM